MAHVLSEREVLQKIPDNKIELVVFDTCRHLVRRAIPTPTCLSLGAYTTTCSGRAGPLSLHEHLEWMFQGPGLGVVHLWQVDRVCLMTHVIPSREEYEAGLGPAKEAVGFVVTMNTDSSKPIGDQAMANEYD